MTFQTRVLIERLLEGELEKAIQNLLLTEAAFASYTEDRLDKEFMETLMTPRQFIFDAQARVARVSAAMNELQEVK